MGTAPSTKTAVRVLSASMDPGLNHSRALLLRDHGFLVETCESVDKAQILVAQENFDALIFGSTLPSDACSQLERAFRRCQSKGVIIEILPSPWVEARSHPDATVVGTDEPASLVNVLLEAVETRRSK